MVCVHHRAARTERLPRKKQYSITRRDLNSLEGRASAECTPTTADSLLVRLAARPRTGTRKGVKSSTQWSTSPGHTPFVLGHFNSSVTPMRRRQPQRETTFSPTSFALLTPSEALPVVGMGHVPFQPQRAKSPTCGMLGRRMGTRPMLLSLLLSLLLALRARGSNVDELGPAPSPGSMTNPP